VSTPGVDRILARCEAHWRSRGVDPATVAEMTAELRAHLVDATAAGKPPESVVGTDLPGFAEEWAIAFRDQATDATSLPRRPGPRWSLATWIPMGLVGAGLVAVAVLAPKEETVDTNTWQWIWAVGAVVLAIGELLTAGFFLLPFAVGAGAAALLAFLGVGPLLQLVTFAVVSILFLAILQRFARAERSAPPATVGANRYLGKRAVVVVPVSRRTGRGLVRMETEEWRATTDLDTEIPEGEEVRVVAVRGTRLVVEPVPPGGA